jgi:hypothetical protein
MFFWPCTVITWVWIKYLHIITWKLGLVRNCKQILMKNIQHKLNMCPFFAETYSSLNKRSITFWEWKKEKESSIFRNFEQNTQLSPYLIMRNFLKWTENLYLQYSTFTYCTAVFPRQIKSINSIQLNLKNLVKSQGNRAFRFAHGPGIVQGGC